MLSYRYRLQRWANEEEKGTRPENTPECSYGNVPFSHRSPPTGVRDTVESSLFICTADTIYKTHLRLLGQKEAL